MKINQYITPFLNGAFILALSLFCLEAFSVLEIKRQAIKTYAYWGMLILPPLVFLWNAFAVKPIKKKLLLLLLPVISFMGVMKIGYIDIIFASSAWETQEVVYKNNHSPFKKVESQRQDIGALGYNRRTVEVTYLTSLFVLVNPVEEDIENRSEWVKVDGGIHEDEEEHNVNDDCLNISVIDAKLPISLNDINFNDETNAKHISDGKSAAIENAIEKYYLAEMEGMEDLYSINDFYVNTIALKSGANDVLYWIIFRHLLGKVNSQLLFYDNSKKEYMDYVHDFNIHALYTLEEEVLKPTDLKKRYLPNHSEVEIVDFDKDGLTDIKLTRLFHNGTANAIEEMIIEVSESQCDTLSFKRNWIYE